MQVILLFSGVQFWAEQVKASGGCHRFLREIFRGELEKIWTQIRQGEFDLIQQKSLNF